MLKHQFDLTHQIVAEPLDLLVRMVDESLKVAFQMSPAPLYPHFPDDLPQFGMRFAPDP